MILKIIRVLYHLLFFVTPLIMFSGTSELFEFNKMLVIYVLATGISALWLIWYALKKDHKIQIPIVGLLLLAFFVTQLLSTFFSIDVHTSIFGYYGRFNGGLLSIIAYLSLFFVFINVFDLVSALRLLKTSLLSSVFVIAWGLPGRFNHDLSCLLFTHQFNNSCWTDQFHPDLRMFSTLGQPNWLGAYLVIQFFIGLFFWVSEGIQNTSKRISPQLLIYGIYLVLVFTTVLFTRSRSALIALSSLTIIFPFGYFFLSKKEHVSKFLKKYSVLLILLLISVLIFKSGIDKIDRLITFQKAAAPTQVESTSQPVFSSEVTESFDIRKIVWKGAIELGRRYPFFGTGPETFAYSYYFTRPVEHNTTSEWDFLYNKAHNEYLNYFATTGFIGLGVYLVFIGYILALFFIKIRQHQKEQPKEAILLLCLSLAFISILITNFFGFSTTTINLFFYILPGFLVLKSEVQEQKDAGTFSTRSLHKKIQVVIVSILAAWLIVVTVRYFLADIQYARADSLSHLNEHEQAAIYLQHALTLHHEHVYEDKLSYELANIAFISSYQKETSQEASLKTKQNTATYVKLAEYFNQASLMESPQNVLYYKTTSKNDYLFYQIYLDPAYLLKGISALDQAAKLSPTDPKLPYTSALFYSLLTDEQTIPQTDRLTYQKRSLEALEQSIALKFNYRDAYLLKGQLLKKYGQKEKATEIFQYILKTFDPKDQDALKELGR